MHVIITTASGSTYTVADGAIVRTGDHLYGYLPAEDPATLVDWDRPTVGQPWRFATVHGWVTTSPVRSIGIPRMAVAA